MKTPSNSSLTGGGLSRVNAYFYLTRFHKPIPILLLLWPTLAALWMAAGGMPSLKLIVIFVLGTLLMRAAGCAINDYADRHVDGSVERTENRPLATGVIPAKHALILFFILSALAFALVILLNPLCWLLALIGFALTLIYPFTKRFFIAPQFFLGLTFSWGIPMAFAAVMNSLPAIAWQFYGATLLWIVMYDTEYAIADRKDDVKIGIYSTAILFGKYDRLYIAVLQVIFLLWLITIGLQLKLGVFYYLALCVVAILFVHQHKLLTHRDPHDAIAAFLHNHWVGLAVFLGILFSKDFL